MRRVSTVPLPTLLALSLAALVGANAGRSAWAVPPTAAAPEPPQVAPASPEASRAMSGFRLPEGWKVSLFAAEPLVANPVAFCLDPFGRAYVCESFRQNRGVTDNRQHDQGWVDDDLAARTVEDRRRYHQQRLPDKGKEYTRYDDRIRVVADTDGDGTADRATVFANRFNNLVDGTGAGVLVRGGEVFYTCIPHLWRLRDSNGDGEADQRDALHTGYGVRVAFRGHDLHGLCVGVDGRLYFSIGDRGYHIVTEGRTLSDPESGAVFRCELDGSGLEVFATGLRNPQELAFDDHGNLFTGDNNSDSGDKARWVYVVRGGDTGWRMAYQYLSDRGPFNREKIWHPYHAEQPASIIPPVTNLADGPSGLIYYPGSGLSDRWRGRFLLCDFRGTPTQSGIRSFRVQPEGAFFKLVDEEQSFWNILATDLALGADGSLYVTDWVNGWNGEGKGRIYRLSEQSAEQSTEIQQQRKLVQRVLQQGLQEAQLAEVVALLANADQRVRLEAQFELVRRQEVATLAAQAESEREFARLHAIWGLGHLGRTREPQRAACQLALSRLLEHDDAEVRAQAARTLVDLPYRPALDRLTELLEDPHPRVRYFAAAALGELNAGVSLEALLKLLADNQNRDPIVRHGAVMALAGIQDPRTLARGAGHHDAAARLGVLLAFRKQRSPQLQTFLDDAAPQLVLEAVRAIHDLPLPDLLPSVAALITQDRDSTPLLQRVLNANYRLGKREHAEALAEFAARATAPQAMRLEALGMLADWAAPSARDRVLGMWRPLPPRSGEEAADAVRRQLGALLAADAEVRKQTLQVAGALGIKEVIPALTSTLTDKQLPAGIRANALTALGALEAEQFPQLLEQALGDPAERVRAAARHLLADRAPERAVALLAETVQAGELLERQAALATLAGMDPKNQSVQRLAARQLELLAGDKTPPELRLDVYAAADALGTFKAQLDQLRAQWQAADPLGHFALATAGGDPSRGAEIFRHRTELSCVRCHQVGDTGGKVGPELTKIGGQKDAKYLLRAIVDPNQDIAKGFESQVVVDLRGRVFTGILKAENDNAIDLMQADGKLVTIPKDAIDERGRGRSAMPDDLVKKLSLAELRDLVAFLQSLR